MRHGDGDEIGRVNEEQMALPNQTADDALVGKLKPLRLLLLQMKRFLFLWQLVRM